MSGRNLLFDEDGVLEIPRRQEQLMLQKIDELDENGLLNKSTEDLCDYFEDQYKFHVPVILDDHICIDWNDNEYYIPKNNSNYTEDDDLVYQFLNECYHV